MQTEQRKIGTSSDGREMHYTAGVVVKYVDRYLLLDRVNPPPGFACPAGHIDQGEEPLAAAIRELEEETGIVVDKLEFIAEEEILWNYCKSATVHYWYLYRVTVDSDITKLEKDEAKSMGWYTAEEMKSLNLEEVWKYWFEKIRIL